MAQWRQLERLDAARQKRVVQLYAQHRFPLDARRLLSAWIEDRPWESIASDAGQALQVYLELLQQVEACYTQLVWQNSLLGGPDYSHLAQTVAELFGASPVNMALTISRCLSEERAIITAASDTLQDVAADGAARERQTQLDNAFEELRREIQFADNEIKKIDEQLGNYDCVLKAWQDKAEELNGAPGSPELKRMKLGVDALLDVVTEARLGVCGRMGAAVALAERVVSQLVEVEMKAWRLRQHQACIGAPADTSLLMLHTWFTSAADAVTLQLRQLRKLQTLDEQAPPNPTLSALRTRCEASVQGLLTTLLTNALVVESQPGSSSNRPLVLKTGVCFSVKTRFLLNMSSFNWMPTVTLSFDKDFAEIGKVNCFRKFGFKKKVESRLMDAERTGLVAQFKGLKLVEEKYKSNRQNESPLAVTEELHFITCSMELQLLGLTFHIEVQRTSTLPLVVISSSIQNPAAWAAVMWSAMAADRHPKNLLFLNPPPVAWQQLSAALSWQFLSVGERGLNEQQLASLKDRFVDNPDDLVTWNKFYKCDAHWVWIEGILDLIKKHLLEMWRDDLIMGFISKEQASVLLQDKRPGTFLLRFSESFKEGAITFSWVDHSKGAVQVHAVQPYRKELLIQSLADALRKYQAPESGLNPLLYLYPDTPMDRAFQHYYNPVKPIEGYVLRDPIHCHPTPPPSPEENPGNATDVSMDAMDVSLAPSESSELFPELYDMLSPFQSEISVEDLFEIGHCLSP